MIKQYNTNMKVLKGLFWPIYWMGKKSLTCMICLFQLDCTQQIWHYFIILKTVDQFYLSSWPKIQHSLIFVYSILSALKRAWHGCHCWKNNSDQYSRIPEFLYTTICQVINTFYSKTELFERYKILYPWENLSCEWYNINMARTLPKEISFILQVSLQVGLSCKIVCKQHSQTDWNRIFSTQMKLTLLFIVKNSCFFPN